jgi:glycosyltransferase involved in cell wall biosynthesis
MIKVSILCITYNHEKFIKQALESFIMQKTNFDFEVIIGEDCSTDNTREIIKEFEKKYPNIIKPIYREKNLGAMANFVDILCKAEGNYIALCEGDDFFIDENKLQVQADFFDNNPEYSVCFHPVKVFFENGEREEHIFPKVEDFGEFCLEELLKNNFIQTNSVMYRKRSCYKNIPQNIMPGDWYLHSYHAEFGRIGFIDKVMATYRKHEGGIWWNAYKDMDELLKKYGIEHLRTYVELLKIFKKKEHQVILKKNIFYLLGALDRLDLQYNTKLSESTIKEFPLLYFEYARFLEQNNKSTALSSLLEQIKRIYKKIQSQILRLLQKK